MGMTFPRVRALILVAVLFVTAGVVVMTAVSRDTQTQPPGDPCQPGDIRVNVAVPRQSDVTLNVYNATQHVGLAEQIAAELRNRKFTATALEGLPEGDRTYDLAGHLIFGPEGVGAAWLVAAYFLDEEYERIFVPEREGPEVDLVLGTDFQQLATTTEVNQAIAARGRPQPPLGTCAA